MPVDLLLPRVKVPVRPLLTYKKLDMAFGVGAGASLYDKSRYRYHGPITTATWAAGVHGSCLNFDLTNPDYVHVATPTPQLNFVAGRFSMVFRFRTTTMAVYQRLISRGDYLVDGWLVQARINGVIGVHTSQLGTSDRSDTSPGSIAINTWYTIGISRNGTSIRIYINGVDDTTIVDVHADPLTSPKTLKIGIGDDLISEPLDGRMEFLRIFGGVTLSASEHLAWHRALA